MVKTDLVDETHGAPNGITEGSIAGLRSDTGRTVPRHGSRQRLLWHVAGENVVKTWRCLTPTVSGITEDLAKRLNRSSRG